MSYTDWINEVQKSRADNEESLREITAGWKLTGATTGRMSQTNPDLQTIPKREDEFKRRRFIGISEALPEETIDNEFLMRFTGP